MFVIAGCQPEEVDSWLTETSIDLKVNQTEAPKMHKDHLSELASVRAATARYHDFDKAMEDGYVVPVPGFFPNMGYHFLNPDYLDYTFEAERPELLIYVPDKNGKMRLVGVEYAVPIDDLENPQPAPEGFTGDSDVWTINRDAHLWTLHAWIWYHNPDGIFAARNPRVPESDD
ncbi:hypothetical protein GCM10010465_24780 [Actinomadura fibrosa]